MRLQSKRHDANDDRTIHLVHTAQPAQHSIHREMIIICRDNNPITRGPRSSIIAWLVSFICPLSIRIGMEWKPDRQRTDPITFQLVQVVVHFFPQPSSIFSCLSVLLSPASAGQFGSGMLCSHQMTIRV